MDEICYYFLFVLPSKNFQLFFLPGGIRYKFADSSEKEIEYIIKEWLKYARKNLKYQKIVSQITNN